jgi:hypothetical protein
MNDRSGKSPKPADAGSGASWWKRILRSLAATTGLLAAGAGVEASPVAVDGSSYRSAAAAPESWKVFSQQLRGQLEQKLEADDDRARHLQEFLVNRGRSTATPLALTVRAWVMPDGKLQRVELDGIDDATVSAGLRDLLIAGSVGTPPPDMLQPLHLRLSLRATDQQQDVK